jgi:hypothetical protein
LPQIAIVVQVEPVEWQLTHFMLDGREAAKVYKLTETDFTPESDMNKYVIETDITESCCSVYMSVESIDTTLNVEKMFYCNDETGMTGFQ